MHFFDIAILALRMRLPFVISVTMVFSLTVPWEFSRIPTSNQCETSRVPFPGHSIKLDAQIFMIQMISD